MVRLAGGYPDIARVASSACQIVQDRAEDRERGNIHSPGKEFFSDRRSAVKAERSENESDALTSDDGLIAMLAVDLLYYEVSTGADGQGSAGEYTITWIFFGLSR